MNVLVTGGAGFIGSHVADTLSGAGHKVRILDISQSPYLRPDQEMVIGSILDENVVRDAVAGQDAVYHFAGMSDLDDAQSRAADSIRQNVLGTVNLLEAARTSQVSRFLHASTIYVYSDKGGFYRCSKQAAELYIEEYQRRYDLDFTILRYGTLYGPRADHRNSVHRLLHQALTVGRIRCDGTGDELREYVNVRDAARLSIQVLAPEFRNQHVIVTGPYPIRYRQLLEMITEIMGDRLEVEFNPDGTNAAHYRVTPVSFAPKIGYKLTSTMYLDMAQGLLECLHEMQPAGELPAAHSAPQQSS